jgi:pilus assembly protein Flp/PilA
MKRLHQLVRSFCANESGVTAMEYAMVAVLIAIVIALAVISVGSTLNTLFTRVASCFPSGGC